MSSNECQISSRLTENNKILSDGSNNIYINPDKLIDGILNCYSNITMNREQQITERIMIREKSKVYIAAIEADTKKFYESLKQISKERGTLILNLCEIIQREEVDEHTLEICKLILDYLQYTNPMNNIARLNDGLLGV